MTSSSSSNDVEGGVRVPGLHRRAEGATLTPEGFYTGTLIPDLLSTAERVRASGKTSSKDPASATLSEATDHAGNSNSKQFPQAPGLSSADGNLGLLLVVHAQLVGTLEPGDDLADSVDVHQVGPVRAPE